MHIDHCLFSLTQSFLQLWSLHSPLVSCLGWNSLFSVSYDECFAGKCCWRNGKRNEKNPVSFHTCSSSLWGFISYTNCQMVSWLECTLFSSPLCSSAVLRQWSVRKDTIVSVHSNRFNKVIRFSHQFQGSHSSVKLSFISDQSFKPIKCIVLNQDIQYLDQVAHKRKGVPDSGLLVLFQCVGYNFNIQLASLELSTYKTKCQFSPNNIS